MREGLADCYEAEENWAEAAKTLAMIDLDSGEGQPRQGSHSRARQEGDRTAASKPLAIDVLKRFLQISVSEYVLVVSS